MSQYLYLVRHGEQQDAQHGMPDGPLSPRGRRQAALIAERLSGLPLDSVYHSPLQRAAETAEIIAAKLPSIELESSALLFDCVPTGPTEDMPAAYLPFFGGITEAETDAGTAQMTDAVAEYLAPRGGDRHDLIISHNFVIAWFVREVLGAPDWRWMTLDQANCGLTIIHRKPGRPWTVLTHNDLAHLPFELRTGLIDPLPV